MKLAKLNPILGNVEKIDRLFDPFLTAPLFPELMVKGFEGTWVPTLDLVENDAAFMVRLEAPGMPKENLDVKLTGEVLTITGHREAARKFPARTSCIGSRRPASSCGPSAFRHRSPRGRSRRTTPTACSK